MGLLLRSNLNFWQGRWFKCFSGWNCNLPCSSKTSGLFLCNDGVSKPMGSFLLVCVPSPKHTELLLELGVSSSKLLSLSLLLLSIPDHPLWPRGVLAWEGGSSLPPENLNDPFYHSFSVLLKAQMPGPYSQISWAQGSLKAILHCRQKCIKPSNN